MIHWNVCTRKCLIDCTKLDNFFFMFIIDIEDIEKVYMNENEKETESVIFS